MFGTVYCIIGIFAMKCSSVYGNLEGPFLFWGPQSLEAYKRPALICLGQDPLLEIYDNQAAIVVFNNQDSIPLSGENFPRLRKLLESRTTLVLPQDFLDVHPDYVNNETQVFTLQGPCSERDAEITETFNRLEDIYGKGRVLSILGSSASQDYTNDYPVVSSDDLSLRQRRQVNRESDKEVVEEPEKQQLYNANGKALLYTSTYPILRFGGENNQTLEEEYALKNAVTVTCDERDSLSKLVVTYAMDQGKIILRFKFPSTNSGYWSLGEVELRDLKGRESLLIMKRKSQVSPQYRGARKGFSYHCSTPLEFTDGSVSLLFSDIQVQPLLGGLKKFGSAYDCVGFTSVPIWSGLAIATLMVFGVLGALLMIMDIRTMDRFENSKGKMLSFTVSE